MRELEEKGQTVLAGRTPIPKPDRGPSLLCAVDGCLNQAIVTCDVRMSGWPDTERHLVHFCKTHDQGFQSLKWQWKRTPDAKSSRLKLEGVYALDAVEDM